MEGASGFTRNIIYEDHSLDIQRDQMECENVVIQSIIDELNSSVMIKWKVKVVYSKYH